MTLAQEFAHKADVSEVDAAIILEFSGIDPNAIWNPLDQSQKCALYESLIGYLAQDGIGIKSVSEGGYSKTYDSTGKASELYRLAKESGCASLIDMYNPQPKVQNASNLW
jgi:hypothetical protein